MHADLVSLGIHPLARTTKRAAPSFDLPSPEPEWTSDEARHSYTQTRTRSIPEMENSRGRKHDFTFCDSANGQLRNRQQSKQKSTRLNSSHVAISYAVFCLKKKKKKTIKTNVQRQLNELSL